MEIKLYNENNTLEKGEFFYLFLIFDKEKISDESYKIILTKIDKYSIDDINVDIPEEKCKLVIESFKKIFEDGYIYTDIIKNPPNPEYFGSVDLIANLDDIKTKDRKFYDFYRDLRRIIGSMKDLHLSMKALYSPNGYDLSLMEFCLPFYFKIKGENQENAKIYIEKSTCYDYYNENEKEFLKSHLNQYIKKINNIDPFSYIQNMNREFTSLHNNHSTFTYNLWTINRFEISTEPLTKEELSNITFVFESDDSITLDYYFLYANEHLNAKDIVEFKNFLEKETKNNYKRLEKKSLSDYKAEFYSSRNKLDENINDSKNIMWKYSTLDRQKGIQCRVDEDNKLNVFKQTTFHFFGELYFNALEVVENCTEEFYSNPYPIVGIESSNGGGVCKLSFYFRELLQAKILPTSHYSVKLSKLMKEYVESDIESFSTDPDMYQRIDIKTCKPFSKFDEMQEMIDDYGNGVKHKRSQYFGIFNSSDLKKHKKRREKYFEKDKLKKPTEILIFTDAFSYSAASAFIKGLQETGAALTVGYLGNPKSNDTFDASQSPSFVGDLSNSEPYQNIKNCGFLVTGVTIYETYNYTFQTQNPTPREYLIHPVDERVPIYEGYSDSLYDRFISESKRILKKYNEENQCNPNNLDLLFDPNNKKDCYIFENDIHAHGGYECDPKTGKWSNICKPYYCDIGYYFDKYQNKCIVDICTKEDKEVKEDDNGIKTWQIILIVVGAILILIIAIIIIFRCRKAKDNIESTGESGPLMDEQIELKES